MLKLLKKFPHDWFSTGYTLADILWRLFGAFIVSALGYAVYLLLSLVEFLSARNWAELALLTIIFVGFIAGFVSMILIAWRLYHPIAAPSPNSTDVLRERTQQLEDSLSAKIIGFEERLSKKLEDMEPKIEEALWISRSIVIRERLQAYTDELADVAPKFDDMFARALQNVAAWDGKSLLEFRTLDKLRASIEKIMIPRSNVFPGKFGPLAYEQKDAPPPLHPVPGEPDGVSDRVKYKYRNIYVLYQSIKDAIASDRKRIASALQMHQPPGELYASYEEPV